ncbi:MAG: nucleotidyl transferase AbiEii/AbiGii toxin family protein [Deltaproteobacteria bacterium]|nr:nucleotidyl transferase AbiEii/AbiGii toxin family protein [Deltaproteobacteria bacterium]
MSLERNLEEVVRCLNRIKRQGVITGYALIGGLSVSTWGFPRGTKDIDLLVSLSLEATHRLKAFFSALEGEGFKPEVFRGGHLDPVPYLVKITHKDVPVDILIATRRWEDEAVERAVKVDFHGVKVPVVPLEYLIVMKLKSGGPRDLLDAEELLKTGGDIETIKGLAIRLRVDKRLDKLRRKGR